MTCQLCCDWLQLNRYKYVLLSFSLTNGVKENGVMFCNLKCSEYKKQHNAKIPEFKQEF